MYKYQKEWKKSLEYSQKAYDLNPKDDGALWNVGIAATALKKWEIANNAWKHLNINIKIKNTKKEPKLKLGIIPTRLTNGEVVWCQRIDPARVVIENIPLPESNHGYKDMLLIDGAPEGTRVVNGRKIPVFNEISIIQKSEFKTYKLQITLEDLTDINALLKC